ncbi:MAG: hypothetical protein LBN05_02885 [Oscillospiraceae bacterium]|jgi:hypothetical protein|nr:hypothetical protein [Oscillospiraceae bacterium]
MSQILDFFNGVVDLVSGLLVMILNTVMALIGLLAALPALVTNLLLGVGYLPSVMNTIAVATIAVSIVLLIVGRQNNGG